MSALTSRHLVALETGTLILSNCITESGSIELAWMNIVSSSQPRMALCSRVHLVKFGDSFGCHDICRRAVAGIYWVGLGTILNSLSPHSSSPPTTKMYLVQNDTSAGWRILTLRQGFKYFFCFCSKVCIKFLHVKTIFLPTGLVFLESGVGNALT